MIALMVRVRRSRNRQALCMVPPVLACALLWPLPGVVMVLGMLAVGAATRWAVYRRGQP